MSKNSGSEIDEVITNVYSKILETAKYVNNLSDFEYNTLNEDEKQKIQNESSKLFKLISNFKEEPEIHEDLTEKYDFTTDLLDNFFENVDTCLDQIKFGKSQNKDIFIKKVENKNFAQTLTSILRPQQNWENDFDNSNSPFIPKIKTKPNAREPLDQSMKRKNTDIQLPKYGFGTGTGSPPNRDSAPHPYYYELQNLEYQDWQLKYGKETKFLGLKNVPCTWIDTVENLDKLSFHLNTLTHFAIDLEQHSFRSFQGFVCLMQISTRDEDYLVDTLKLRTNMHILNQSFTNPKIQKILHGSENDILWLQRDFGLYIVNMFDTGQASRVLELPSFSYSYLLKTYCSIEADKKYQLADWRIRPLPEEMVTYARQDTHYLLYIHDKLRAQLREKIPVVLNRSKELCLQRYEKPLFTDASYLTLLGTTKNKYNTKQNNVFRNLFKWREEIARREDESTKYVLPNHMLFTIAEGIPKNPQNLISLCNPCPALLRKESDTVFKLLSLEETYPTEKKEKQEEETVEHIYSSAGWTEQPSINMNELSSDEDRERKTVDVIKEANTSNLFDDFREEVNKNTKVQKLYESFTFGGFSSFGTKNLLENVIKEKEEEPIKEKPITKTTEKEEVPKSLNEIYNISQKNKGSKTKKFLKQESIIDSSSAYTSQDNQELSKPIDFMKKIGWVSTNEKEIKKINQEPEKPMSNNPPPKQPQQFKKKSYKQK